METLASEGGGGNGGCPYAAQGKPAGMQLCAQTTEGHGMRLGDEPNLGMTQWADVNRRSCSCCKRKAPHWTPRGSISIYESKGRIRYDGS